MLKMQIPNDPNLVEDRVYNKILAKDDSHAYMLGSIFMTLWTILGDDWAKQVETNVEACVVPSHAAVKAFWDWTARTGGVQDTADRDSKEAQEAGELFLRVFVPAAKA